ncbi:hypothetical protein AVEN_261264-1 [Araneus ventricosus]|uniref:Uncharacterized protein n=1 Tax=Araneus ventricosus TaxID=182803 RepID=A0A4Y1ZSB3_ARAVE|nr:hypothetical protein AVEN_261264-1 [Araneus ventricosus]
MAPRTFQSDPGKMGRHVLFPRIFREGMFKFSKVAISDGGKVKGGCEERRCGKRSRRKRRVHRVMSPRGPQTTREEMPRIHRPKVTLRQFRCQSPRTKASAGDGVTRCGNAACHGSFFYFADTKHPS